MNASEAELIKNISCAAVARDPDRALLLDVRTPAEFSSVHIPGAVLHPLSELNIERVREFSQGKEQCVVICRSGGRARQAAQKLAGAIPNIVVLEGGVTAWEAAGLPVERGAGAISLERQVRIAAGALVLIGVLLGTLVNPLWYGLSGFIGAGLIFAGVTDTCGMAMVLAQMPWNTRLGGASTSCAVK
jgi:rhodanese-related sulfurtransferase